MKISERSKISFILKKNPDALEAIISLSPAFKKLRNPILRKMMAGRTSIAMASKIGGCTPDDFFKVLAEYGFEKDDSIDKDSQLDSDEAITNNPMPAYLQKVSADRIVEFDVRAMLADGNDPLKLIQDKIKTLKSGEVLKIINTFEPVPLIQLLEKKGYEHYVKFVSDDVVETYFYSTSEKAEKVDLPEAPKSGDWEQKLADFGDKLKKITVSHLEMPQPMLTILGELEELPEDYALYVYHKRIPVFLLSELNDRNFEYRIKEIQDNEVHLLIFRS